MKTLKRPGSLAPSCAGGREQNLESLARRHRPGSIGAVARTLIYPDAFFAALCLECLLTSLFFVLAIASKSRYHTLQREVQFLVQMAIQYDKDEKAKQRLADLTNVVENNHISVQESVKRLKSTISYMNFFRTIGFILFCSLLITGSFLISNYLGLVILVIIGISLGYCFQDFWRAGKFLDGLAIKVKQELGKGVGRKVE